MSGVSHGKKHIWRKIRAIKSITGVIDVLTGGINVSPKDPCVPGQ